MMASPNSPLFRLLLLIAIVVASAYSIQALDGESDGRGRAEGGFGRRILLSFKEIPKGGNVTYECSPSGPCVPCLYSEKNDEKYRCSETGYRIPFKCVEIENVSKQINSQKPQKRRSALENHYDKEKLRVMLHDGEELTTSRHRNLLDDSSTEEGSSQVYITYRSCLPAAHEEKLSVLGFQGIVLCLLLISGSVIYFRRKRSVVMPGIGTGRIQTSSRF